MCFLACMCSCLLVHCVCINVQKLGVGKIQSTVKQLSSYLCVFLVLDLMLHSASISYLPFKHPWHFMCDVCLLEAEAQTLFIPCANFLCLVLH